MMLAQQQLVSLLIGVLLAAGQTLSSPSIAAGPAEARTASQGAASGMIRINRAAKELELLDSNGRTVTRSRIGIGKGGLAKKRSMDDEITPTGRFVVDVVLSENPELCRISQALKVRYAKNKTFAPYVGSKSGLARMFKNMNSLDFDGDKRPDTAYGEGYIGLNAAGPGNQAITGPKARVYQGKVSWYSIALHGTPDPEKALGAATSGGCVHVDSLTLKQLLGAVIPGTPVEIFDK